MITLKNVNKYFFRRKKNEIHVINNTSLELGKTGLVALLGPSGSGKTTLLNAIGGLDKIDAGEISIDGERLPRGDRYKKDKLRVLKIGYIFQDYNLLDYMTVFENIELSLKMVGIKNREEIKKRVDYILNAVGMYRYRNKTAGNLSGGQRQRVGIARALVKNPDVIIADEPTGNLDSKNTIEIMNIIKKISQEKLVILVTHEKDLAQFYASRIIDLVDGRIVADRDNIHENELDYRIDNKIYLKDFKVQETVNGETSEIVVYSDKKENLHLDIVVKNGNLYIKSKRGEKIEIVDEESPIEFVDDHYKKIKREDYDENDYELDKLGITQELRYSSIYNVFTMLKTGFKKVANYPFLKKILLSGFFFSAMFILYALSSIFGATRIDDKNFLNTHRDYIIIENKANKLDDYLKIEKMSGVDYVIPGDSQTTLSISNPKIWQLSGINMLISGAVASINILNEKDIIIGEYPSNENEIVLDKYVLDLAKKKDPTIEWLDLHKYEDYVGLKPTINGMTFEIVGISSTGDPCIYFAQDRLLDIVAASQGRTGQYIEDTMVAHNLIANYVPYKENLTLVEGHWPDGDYETIVNYSQKNYMAIGQTIDTLVGDEKLKVVGYYTSKTENDEYYVGTNTFKYDTILRIPHMLIASQDKEATIGLLQDEGYGAKDVYEVLRKNYIESIKDNVREALVLAGVLLAISFIEIFLMIRASFLSRIKEVGIYRAIGVKKMDIYKMFLGEILVITTIAGLPGAILMGSIMKEVAGIPILGNMFVMNTFIMGIGIILVYLLNIVIGLLPVYSTIKKTPAEILSRNDVD